jgi:uridine kinase
MTILVLTKQRKEKTMHEEHNTKLWFSPSGEGLFLIPDSTSLSEGDLELNNYFGKKMYVDASEAGTCEVTGEAAMNFIKDKVDSFFANLSEKITEHFRNMDWLHPSEELADIVAPIFSSDADIDDDGETAFDPLFEDEDNARTMN